MEDTGAEKIRIYEQYRRGEITETELRESLSDGVVDSMKQEREAFEAATERDTSVFLSSDST